MPGGGNTGHARERANDALQVAEALGRPSEIAQARAMLAKAALMSNDMDALSEQLEALDDGGLENVSAHVRQTVEFLRRKAAGHQPNTEG